MCQCRSRHGDVSVCVPTRQYTCIRVTWRCVFTRARACVCVRACASTCVISVFPFDLNRPERDRHIRTRRQWPPGSLARGDSVNITVTDTAVVPVLRH